MKAVTTLSLAACVACTSLARASAPASPTEVRIPSGPYMLRAFIFRPAGPGPFPALVYNHGSERDPSLDFMGELGAWFQRQGWVVVFPFRRGASDSEGPYWRDLAEASPADDRQRVIVELMIAENDDVLAAADYARS